MDKPGLLLVVVGGGIVVVAAPLVDGTGRVIVSLVGVLVTLSGAWLVWKSRPSGGG